MRGDVGLHRGEAASVALAEQPLEYHLRVGDARSSTRPVWPASTPDAVLLPLFPWGRALNPWAPTVLARERVSPVLLQNSASLHVCGSNPSPSSAAISRSAASIISCRSSCLSFTSMVLLAPACWHHQRSGGGEARWPLFGDRDRSKSFDY